MLTISSRGADGEQLFQEKSRLTATIDGGIIPAGEIVSTMSFGCI